MTDFQTNRGEEGDSVVYTGSETSNAPPASAAATESPAAQATAARESIHNARRYRWKWNGKLLLITAVVALLGLTAAVGSYYYNSAKTAETFLGLAQIAAKDQDFEEQAKWLRRYALLMPDDVNASYQMAIAADKAVDGADRKSRGLRVDAARRALSRAIGQIGSKDDEKVLDLRQRLIHRLVQLGGPWNREAERQIITLNAAENDPQSLKSLAIALAGEIADGSYSVRDPDAVAKVDSHWGWLANQSPTLVLVSALRQNPNNFDLIVHFLFTRLEQPEVFHGTRGGAAPADSELAEVEKQTIAALRDMSTSHANLLLYRYLQINGNTDEAESLLRSAAESARQRLLASSQKGDSSASDADASTSSASEQESETVTANPMPTAYWDFIALFDAARLDQETEPEKALEQMQFLTTLEIPTVPAPMLESLYFESGKLLVALDRSDEALAVWNDASKSLEGNSILLPRAIATVYASQNNWDAADKATQQLAEAIDASDKRLARMTDAELARSERIVQGRRLAAARWQLNVLKSYLAAGRGDKIRAIDLLRKATDSNADVPAKDRVDALTHLASYYANQGIWDASATSLERAVALDPENAQLRRLTSEAWNRAGNQASSVRQMDLINEDFSLLGTIAEVESRFAYQLQLPPQQQNFVQIRDSASQLKQLLEKRLTSSADLPEEQVTALRSSLHYIEAFEITIPPEGTAADVHLHSADVARQLDELAKQYPDEPNLQALAAERLAQCGLESDAMAALERLEKGADSAGISPSLVHARVLSALGKNVEAAKLLINSAQDIEQSSEAIPSKATIASLLQDAAVFASRGHDNELAYQALIAIPADQRSLQTLSAITQLALNLPAGSKSLTLDGKKVSAADLYKHWFDELRQYEGSDGTYWRYLRANELLVDLRKTNRALEPDNFQLVEARKLADTILTLRPKWGDAIALQGRISALAGDAENAVTQLRRAIAAGSVNLQTRQLLWQQLIALGRTEEAEREIELAELTSSGQTDQLSATLIDLAMKQGDYSKSMQVAMESATNQPEDVNAQLVVAATGTTAMANVTDSDRRKELKEQIDDAISSAAKLATPDDPRVIAASLRLAIALQDEKQIDALIERIGSAKMAESAMNQLLSQAYAAKNDYEQALKFLTRADELDPTSNSQLRLAEVFRLLERPEDELSALRKAVQRDPTNDRLRNLLAQKMVARSAEGQPVDWQAVGDVLAGSGGGGAAINQVMHAILLGSEAVRELSVDAGSQPARLRLSQAKTILRGLVKKQSGDWQTPARYLATLLQQEAAVEKDLGEAELARINTEIRSIYQSLIDSSPVEASDLYQYASYLLNQKNSDDNATIKNLSNRLDSLAGNSLQALEVSARYADRQGKRDQTPEIVSAWANRAIEKLDANAAASANDQGLILLMTAGNSLQKLGFAEDALSWFERAYKKYPTQALGPYIVALGRTEKLDQAVDVCAKHYAEHHDAQSATLLVEVLLNYSNTEKQAKQISVHEEALTDARENLSDNTAFLEGLGTLKMAEGQYDQAVKCFVSALKVTPKSIRSLNNLAMSFAEIPSRASEGIAPINSALQLAGQNPELMDTKGVVLMAAGRLGEAEATFSEAHGLSDEPRHLFHLILAQIKQDKEAEAAKNWKELDMEKLDPMGLTANERITLKELKAKYASSS